MKITLKNLHSDIIKNAVKFYLETLLKDKQDILDEIEVDLEVFDLENKKTPDTGECQGFCTPLDCEDKDYRSFLIEIESGKSEMFLRALAHECVHIYQFVSGFYKYTDQMNIMKWKGKKYDISNYYDDYYDFPWEIEAFGRELGLTHKFLNTIAKEKELEYA